MAVRVDEDSCIAAVERRGRRTRDVGAGLLRCCNEFVDFGSGSHVVSERNTSKTIRLTIFNAVVERELVAIPQDQRETARLEEDSFLNGLPFPTQGLVERPGTFEVGNTQCNQADALFHGLTVSVPRVLASVLA